MDNFFRDLTIGQQGEEYICKKLENGHKGLSRIKTKCKEYDLEAPDGYTVEVKFDFLSEETGNVGIEIRFNKEKSGLLATKAIDWAHIYKLYNDWVYSIVPVNDLKAFLRNNKDYLPVVKSGDSNASKMVLIKTHDFADSFSFHKIESPNYISKRSFRVFS